MLQMWTEEKNEGGTMWSPKVSQSYEKIVQTYLNTE